MSARKSVALFAECKWKNSGVGADVYHNLKRKSEMFPFNETFLYVLTKIRPSVELLRLEHEHGLVKCFSLQEMINELDKSPEQ